LTLLSVESGFTGASGLDGSGCVSVFAVSSVAFAWRPAGSCFDIVGGALAVV
jgi:hypothetical protein